MLGKGAGAVKEITSDAEYKTVLETNAAAIVDFTAVWCPPCKVIAPVFSQLAEKHTGVGFYKVDIDDPAGRVGAVRRGG